MASQVNIYDSDRELRTPQVKPHFVSRITSYFFFCCVIADRVTHDPSLAGHALNNLTLVTKKIIRNEGQSDSFL